METISRKAAAARSMVEKFIESLYQTFLKYKSKNQTSENLKEKLAQYDENNPEYSPLVHNKREQMTMLLLIVCGILSILIDVLATLESGKIISDLLNWPLSLAIIFPIALIILEVGVAYFQIEKRRKGELNSWISKNAQYVVMLIVCGMIGMTVIYSIKAYYTSPDPDGAGLIGTLVYQLFLLLASILLHIWIIKNAEDILDAVSFWIYKLKRNNMVKKIEKLDKEQTTTGAKQFAQDVQKLIKLIEAFHREHPEVHIDFRRTMPDDLIKAMDQVMGKNFMDRFYSRHPENISYEPC